MNQSKVIQIDSSDAMSISRMRVVLASYVDLNPYHPFTWEIL